MIRTALLCILSLLSFFAASRASAATWQSQQSAAAQNLNLEEYAQYKKTISLCSGNGLLSSAKIGFDSQIINSALNNILGVLSLDAGAWVERHRAGYISPEASRLMHSAGFRLAVHDCFGDNLSGAIYKNMVTLYQLAAELTGTFGGGAVTSMFSAVANKFPTSFRILVAWRISLSLQALINLLREEYFTESTPEEKQMAVEIMKGVSGDFDETRKNILTFSYKKRADTVAKLASTSITPEERTRLMQKLDKLNAAIARVEQDIPK